MENKIDLTWIEFYSEFADKLLPYKKDRKSLIEIIKNVYENIGINLPKLDTDFKFEDIDPFTIYGLFNKGITDGNRIKIITEFAKQLNISAIIPTNFAGIPVFFNTQACMHAFASRGINDIDNLWELLEISLNYEKQQNDENKKRFIDMYDITMSQKCTSWKLTMALYWIRPNFYLTLDSLSRDFIFNNTDILDEIVEIREFKKVPNGENYIKIKEACEQLFKKGDSEFDSFPELSQTAWLINQEEKKKTKIANETKKLNELNEIFEEEKKVVNDKKSDYETYPPYTKDEFLSEVYMDNEYDTLVSLLKTKKNVILQGAPGVGKTYIAERLAFSIMEYKDKSRVMMVQFHQSYSYEDLIMGYRPTETGFKLKTGPFYDFCKEAAKNKEKDYFFIIDEINRGNLSKVFGELFMLIENDKREIELQTLYSDEKFSVPNNLYIIGMMNTADRSLAMIDYALRRRFAFFELKPAFSNSKFIEQCKNKNNDKFNELIKVVERLNKEIAEDETLGLGFVIGHSYFCIKENNIDDDFIDSIVKYELIPLIKEYWFDDKSKVEYWERELEGALK